MFFGKALLHVQSPCSGELDSRSLRYSKPGGRRRYSAYVLGLRDYLVATWHPSTRPVPFELDLTPGLRWLGLEVRRHAQLGNEKAVVEFVARYKPGSAPAVRLHEISRFERVDGRWLYVDGEFPE
ncbi:MAG: zinc chelation protein SecC [Gammaproteobacteria bacterium]|nr:zinc chelation protein SecC [Gammaproteobacteria bacterium]